MLTQCLFQWRQEAGEDVDHETIGRGEDPCECPD